MNVPRDVQIPTTAGTVRLHEAANTRDILVADASPLLGYDVRVREWEPSIDTKGGYRGDLRTLAAPFTLRVLITRETEELARGAIDSLHSFAINSEYVQHLQLGKYRALHTGLAVGDFLPRKINGNFTAWWVDMTLLPVFAEATSSKTRDEETYILDTGSPS